MTYEELKRLSPCPINKNVPTSVGYNGEFWWGKIGDIRPYDSPDFEPFITIATFITNPAKRISVLVHEIGHALHHRRHCKCFTDVNRGVLVELHAMRFALRFMLRYRLTDALRQEIDALSGTHNEPYATAANLIKKEKIWNRCLDFLGVKP